MKQILSKYDHKVMMYVKFHEDVIRLEKLLPFDRKNINASVHLELKLGSRWLEFHKTLLDIYGNDVIIHIKFGQDV